MTTASPGDALAVMIAEQQINKVLLAYCQGVDRRDWDQVRACYHDGARDSHGAFVGDPDQLVRWLVDRHKSVLSSMHVLTNVSIRFADNRRFARTDSYCLSLQVVDAAEGDPFAGQGDGPVFTTVACRYVDTFEDSSETGWRIRERKVAFEWIRRSDTTDFVPLDPSWTPSRRDSSDPWYAPFPLDLGAGQASDTQGAT